MTRNTALTEGRAPRWTRTLKASALFLSGAAVGLAVATVASYSVMSLFVPAGHGNDPRVAALAPSAKTSPVLAPVALPARTALQRSAAAPRTDQPEQIADIGILDDGPTETAALLPHATAEAQIAAPAPAPRTAARTSIAPETAPTLPPAPTLARADAQPDTLADTLADTQPGTLADTLTDTLATPPETAVTFIAGRPPVTPPARPAFAQTATEAATEPTTEAATIAFLRPARAPGRTALPASTPAPAQTPEATMTLATMNGPEPTDSFDLTDPASPFAVRVSARPAPRPADLMRTAAFNTEADTGTEMGTETGTETDTGAALQTAAFQTTDAGSAACGQTLARAMPARASGAAAGSAFIASLGNASGGSRDDRIIAELSRGNMPTFLHALAPVTFTGKDARGRDTKITVCVTPDYLALGSDRDFVRVPLGLPAAARIAGRFDMTLPTPRMVDAIYAQAEVRLAPAPMTPGPQMSSTPYFLRHNATIEGQRKGKPGLISGHKKDVVMAARMASAPGRVAIYGWHRTSGKPIQPVSTVHGASYADYSHGIRLVSKTAYLNGKPVALGELLASRQYAYLLNAEGPMPGSVIRIASR